MYKRNDSFFKHFDFLLLDTICLIVSFFLGYLIRSSSDDFVSSNAYINILLWMIVPNILYYLLLNPYKDVLKRSRVEEFKLALKHVVINFLFTVSIMYVLKTSFLYSRLILGYTYVIYFFLSIFARIAWKSVVLKNLKNAGNDETSNILLICRFEEAEQIIYNINNSDYNRRIIKALYFVNDDEKADVAGYKVVQKQGDLYNYVVDNNIHVVFVATRLNQSENKVIKRLIEEGIEIQLYIDSVFGVEAEDIEISNIGMYNTVQLNSYVFTPRQRLYFYLKRFIDIVVSLIGCLFLAPIYLVIKLSYVFSGDHSPIMYTQKRIGLDGKPFDLYKFRSMVPNADEVLKELLKNEEYRLQWEKNQKFDDDPRITKVGKIIRKTSIDEVPQFINVLKGDMSIIGPRPLVPGELKSKNGIKLYERVKPGITGWWACNGRSDMSYEERLEHEYYYVRNCSLYLDIMCVIRTIYVVAFGKGAK